ncbi:MAG TPA: cbb3-type cytochrome c oxidase subunit I [Candidatus Binataceae bacterium]|nr:cbb3-type cytochrome c oxidase subunit I [Candidatus Binataceae bacterium]
MSSTAAVSMHEAHAEHHELGFMRTYIFSTDHKMIGKQFLVMALFMMSIGGLMAMLMRLDLAYPDTQFSFLSILPGTLQADNAIGGANYNAMVTMHATIMIFFVIMPILAGTFANFLIPLMIGARDMAFPKLNMMSFWTAFVSAVIMVSSFFVPQGPAAAGWTSYAPLSASTDPNYMGVYWGQNLWCISIIVLGASSMMGAINYITTIINLRTKGMTFFRLPLVIWSLFITAILLLLALPVLTTALALLLFDRMGGTHFFLPAGGGEPLLWQHLFWFFGHPEVYIMILPAMGITSDVLATFSRKPIFGYRAMAYAMAAIAFLSWIVWGHHMFQSGMNPGLGSGFMLTTMVIAVPSAIKTFNWLGTLYKGNIHYTTAMLNALSFVAMFVIGGLSGIFMACTPVDMYIHDTYFIVAHIHYVLFGGSLFGVFAGIAYWYPKMFGRMMSEKLGKIHFWITFVAFNCTFFPMHILGMGGHMRRIYNPMQYDFLKPLHGMNMFVSYSAFVLGAAQFIFLANLIYSYFYGEKAADNPWHANTLEWTAPTPPLHGNWPGKVPVVYRGPYEYSSPETREDYWPQSAPPEPVSAAAD